MFNFDKIVEMIRYQSLHWEDNVFTCSSGMKNRLVTCKYVKRLLLSCLKHNHLQGIEQVVLEPMDKALPSELTRNWTNQGTVINCDLKSETTKSQ